MPELHPGQRGAMIFNDSKTKGWLTLAPMPCGRHGFGGGVIGNVVYFAGGSLKPRSGGITDQLITFTLP